MGGNAPEFVWRDGSRLTPYMAYQVERLDADLMRIFGVRVLVTSGVRLHQEQIDIFLDTYTPQAYGSGLYADVRWWQGVRYVRTDPSGTAAVPGDSNHEIQGELAAMDLRDTGSDPGISSMGSERSEWLRAHAADYDMDPEGFEFDEAWHYRIHHIFAPVPGGGTTRNTNLSEEDDMPDSMFAVVDGVPSWCWLNWATGKIFAVHTQAEANWIAGYMGSVRFDWSHDPIGGDKYKNKLALFGIMCTQVQINGPALTEADFARIEAYVNAGTSAVIAALPK